MEKEKLRNIDKVHLKNFRVFKKPQALELRPLTFLIGKNNSGKSSVWKALMLLAENVKQRGWAGMNTLEFTGVSHGLESFERAISYDYEESAFRIGWETALDEIELMLDLEYRNIQNIGIVLSHLKLTSQDTVLVEAFTGGNIEVNFKEVSKYSIKQNRSGGRGKEKESSNKNTFFSTTNLEGKEKILSIDSDLVKGFLQSIQIANATTNSQLGYWITQEDFDRKPDLLSSIQTYINQYNDPVLDYFIQDEKIVFEKKKKGESNQNYLSLRRGGIDFFIEVNSTVRGWISSCFNVLRNELDHIGAYRGESKLVYDRADLLGQLLSDYLRQEDYEAELAIQREEAERINKAKQVAINDEEKQEAGIEAKLNDEEKEAIKKEIREDSFFKKCFEENFNEVTTAAPILEDISGSKSHFKIQLQRNNKKEDLMNLGVGTVQLLPLLLKIQLAKGKTLVVEEPENSLHPNYQSKLANVICNAYSELDVRFIVETHSEYIVRQLQYLVVAGRVDKEDILIYYLESNGLQSSTRRIEILSDGKLSSFFGDGFFNEAAKLQYSTINTKKK